MHILRLCTKANDQSVLTESNCFDENGLTKTGNKQEALLGEGQGVSKNPTTMWAIDSLVIKSLWVQFSQTEKRAYNKISVLLSITPIINYRNFMVTNTQSVIVQFRGQKAGLDLTRLKQNGYRAAFLCGDSKGGSITLLIHVSGRIPFLVTVGQRSLFLCSPLGEHRSQLLEAT